jgi:hypothetical protein
MKRRGSPRVFISSGNHNVDQGVDLAMVDDNGNVVVLDAKAGKGQFFALAQSLVQGKYGAGKTRLFVEGQSEQALLHALGASSVLFGTGVDLPPLALNPPRLADFLISMIPVKHRENLAGDLEQDYRNRLIPRHGLRTARFLYWVQVIYAFSGFLARPLARIAGIGWIGRLIEIGIHRMMR